MEAIRRDETSLRAPRGPDLMRRLTAGDESALAALYDRFSGGLYALARGILGEPSEAEEVLQEVFVHAWRHAASYDASRASVSTWLVLLARSRALDRLRRRRVARRAVQEAGREAPERETAAGVGRVQQEERRRRVRAELATLPGGQRRVLELAYYGGLTQNEIAAAEGIPLGTVKTRTLLGLRKLRAALRDELRELL